MEINIKGMDKAEVLAKLYNASAPQGFGVMHYSAKDMTVEEASELINAGRYKFDYLKGRVMKVNLSGDSFDTRLYDRDNGKGAAAYALGIDLGEEQ